MVHARFGKQAAVEMVISAKECGFPGIKIHPPTIGYPNNPDLYPAYEKCQELGLHVQIHTGVEESSQHGQDQREEVTRSVLEQ